MSGEAVKPHGRDCPLRCSLCLGAKPRVVTVDGSLVLIDGEPSGRAVDKENGVQTYYARRGGNATARRPNP